MIRFDRLCAMGIIVGALALPGPLPAAPAQSDESGRLITLDAEDAYLPSVLKILAEEGNLNIVTGPGGTDSAGRSRHAGLRRKAGWSGAMARISSSLDAASTPLKNTPTSCLPETTMRRSPSLRSVALATKHSGISMGLRFISLLVMPMRSKHATGNAILSQSRPVW